MYKYGCYNAALFSDVALDDLPVLQGPSHGPELFVELAATSGQGVWLERAWQPYAHHAPVPGLEVLHAGTHADPLLRLDYVRAGCRFILHPGSGRIHASLTDDAGAPLLQRLLTGPVVALALRLRGQLALHASVSAAPHGAIAFAADAGCGKTTLAAECARRGWLTVADDVLVSTCPQKEWVAHPGPRSRHMWPETVMQFAGYADQGAVHPGTDKRYVRDGEFGRASFASEACPLRALVFLEDFDAHADDVDLIRLSTVEAVGRIMRSRYGLVDTPGSMRAGELVAATSLASAVPCFCAIRPDRPDTYVRLVDRLDQLPI